MEIDVSDFDSSTVPKTQSKLDSIADRLDLTYKLKKEEPKPEPKREEPKPEPKAAPKVVII